MSVSITSRIRIRGINPYLLVTAKQVSALREGWRRPMPVLVTLNGQPRKPARVNLMPVGNGSFYLYLNGPLRQASGTGVGDRVIARVAFDSHYRGGPAHRMPPALRRGLQSQPKRAEAWRSLTPSRQKEILRYLAGLRSKAALERNVAKVLVMLSQPRGLYLGRERATARAERAPAIRTIRMSKSGARH